MKAKDNEDPKTEKEFADESEEIPEVAEEQSDAVETAGSSDEDAEPTESGVKEPESVVPAVDGTGDGAGANPPFSGNIKRILDIQLPVTVSFGSTIRPLSEILKMTPGSLIELETTADEPVVLKINNRPFAWGRVVDVDGYYGVEISEIVGQADRIATLGGN